MIRTLVSLTLSAVAVMTFIGCSDEPQPTQIESATAASVNEFGCRQENVEAPKWTCVPEVDGYYAGVGIAMNSAAGMAHMRKVALANGRSDLAQQIQTQVKDKVETYTGATGNGSQETVDIVTTAVSKQLAKVDLQNSKAIDTWNAPSGALFMLVTVPKANINKEVKDAVTSSFKSDDALWQQFRSKEALESLDKEFPSE